MITLVHGTWPRGFKWHIMRLLGLTKPKLWFESKSPFREKLESSLKDALLDCEIRPFCWSGANSVFARDGAAQKLARVLKDDLKSNNATPIVIAHSHGGNVALRAMTHLGADASRVRIVTLAAPFLRVFVRDPLSDAKVISLWLLLLFAIALIVGFTFIAIVLILTTANLSGDDFLLLFSSSMAAGAVVGYFVAGRLVDNTSKRPFEIQEATAYDSRDAAAPRMLVIRGVDDEAALFLAAGAIGARLSYFILFGPVLWLLAAYAVFLLSAIIVDKGIANSLFRWLAPVSAFCRLRFFLLVRIFQIGIREGVRTRGDALRDSGRLGAGHIGTNRCSNAGT